MGSTLKELNPTAYEELLDIIDMNWGDTGYKKDNLPAAVKGVSGKWRCPQNHIWFSSIDFRKDKNTDPSCPICKSNNKSVNPRFDRMLLQVQSNRPVICSEWYCKKCHTVYIKRDDMQPTGEDKDHICFQLNLNTPVFSKSHPELAEHWLADNKYFPAEITKNHEGIINWFCTECNMVWPASPKDVVLGRKQCPYCTGKYPLPNESITNYKPEVMNEWNYALNKTLIRDYYSEDYLRPDKMFYNAKNIAPAWTCSDCGYVYRMSPYQKIVEQVTCPNCSTFKYTRNEILDMYEEYSDANPIKYKYASDYKKIVFWNCKACGMTWNASPYERVYKKRTCRFCVEKTLAIPGKTSLLALNPELVSSEWKYICNLNIVDPDFELPTSKKTVWWKCQICNKSYKKYISDRVDDYIKNKNSCPFCKGYRRHKHRFF